MLFVLELEKIQERETRFLTGNYTYETGGMTIFLAFQTPQTGIDAKDSVTKFTSFVRARD